MWKMITRDITAPYSAVEAWIYDRVVAPVVVSWLPELAGDFINELPHGASVLDVGCGGGQNLLAVGHLRPDLALTGVDLSTRQVARATGRAARANLPIRFVEGDALKLPFAEGQFEAVVSIASIKHWPDQSVGLTECVRVLKPGGALFVAEADRGCTLRDARAMVNRMRVPRLLRPFSLASFRTWVAGQGLEREESRELLASMPLDHQTVERIPGTPALLLRGTKRDLPGNATMAANS